ncbi:DNA internalization-related competence protein ComEC/Rec2 [Thiotrichales bacterium 19S3-7]|nr:DNA internalization-related competence protein ComEC/Rec2 [Thiotrichales bacterium 19S3-7]MCF6801102.1 DNA internalization-related competence protein ComEC/Rec2 [Thiotrichales bacterium 19S3-11]
MKNKNYIVWLMLIFLSLCLLHGIYVVRCASQSLAKPLLGNYIMLRGVIIDLPVNTNRYQQFILKSEIGKLRLNWYQKGVKTKLIPGQIWQFKVKLKQPPLMRNFYGFDYGSYLRRSGIVATGNILKHSAKLIGNNLYQAPIDYLRYHLNSYLKKRLPSQTFLGIFSALIIGDKQAISFKQKEVFKKTATSHLIAISGLHVGLVALWAYLIIRLIWSCSFKLTQLLVAQKAAWIVAVMIAILYSLLAGFAIPTQRAVIMLLLFAASYLWDLSVSKRYILMTAALAVILYNPYSITSPGFWLSFTAVAFLLFVFTGRLGVGGLLKKVLWPQWIATISLIPLTIFYFGGFSVVGFVANLIAVPVISFIIVPALLISLLTSLLADTIASFILYVTNYIFYGLWCYLHYLSQLKIAFIPVMVYPSLPLLVLALLGVFMIFLPRGFPNRYLGGIFILPLLFYRPSWPDSVVAKLTLLDVNHGLAIIFQMKKYVLVYDTGGEVSSGLTMADMAIIPYLNAFGIDHINRLVISHGDLDHSAGVKNLLQNFKIVDLDASSDKNIPKAYLHRFKRCQEGQSWQVKTAQFSYLNPSGLRTNATENNLSCVLKITLPHLSVLLPGDIEKTAEKYLVNYHYGQLNSTILIAPHHGSKTSSGLSFLKAVKPEVILISNSLTKLRYFPHPLVIKAYRQLKMNYFDTAHYGAIEIILYKGGKISINTRLNTKNSSLTR